jgi:hypothetical protein
MSSLLLPYPHCTRCTSEAVDLLTSAARLAAQHDDLPPSSTPSSRQAFDSLVAGLVGDTDARLSKDNSTVYYQKVPGGWLVVGTCTEGMLRHASWVHVVKPM